MNKNHVRSFEMQTRNFQSNCWLSKGVKLPNFTDVFFLLIVSNMQDFRNCKKILESPQSTNKVRRYIKEMLSF